ncbi:Mutanase [Trichoderma simmonsii]|uniref:Mutanase n=1 Tax=Trichoderma simmonsii TaxID=1491479 RepID=A0A8G0PNQ7_9HYPO|nr:Mutanase [Trichoderma simmonsii]
MKLFDTLGVLTALVLVPCRVQAAAVFAHFMVGNVPTWGVNDWESNMRLAQASHIDAFALNMASGWPQNDASVAQAFQAAEAVGFQLFFSFDYAGNGSWPMDVVTRMLNQYGGSSAHFKYQGKPFASTFEGPANADDWNTIKANTGCFFVPNYSSLGAGPAVAAGGGVADGLFSWAAWPYGPNNMTTYVDASYRQALGDKPYMMGVSPWFFTNLPGYDKNWLWRGDDLWYHRWQQVMTVQPEFIEIITWNDFGESHYIGPLDDRQYGPFDVGKAPFNYVENMPHDGFRAHLPFLIDMYKGGQPAIGQESLVVYYRNTPGAACASGGTTGNTASQLQIEFEPSAIMEDNIFFTALLESPAYVEVTNDKNQLLLIIQPEEWDYVPMGGIGIYHHSVPMGLIVDDLANYQAKLYRPPNTASDIFVNMDMAITSKCPSVISNWNVFVASGTGKSSSAKQPAPISQQVCTSGFAISQGGAFDELCRFTCSHGYCPLGACVCTNTGAQPDMPPATSQPGFPANGDANYGGLCSFACNFGFCPSDACSSTPQPPFVPQFSPFSDPAATAGVAAFDDEWNDLCQFTCSFGFCPMARCRVTSTGFLNVPPAPNPDTPGEAPDGDDFGLCAFACSRGHCVDPCVRVFAISYNFDHCDLSKRVAIAKELAVAVDMADMAAAQPDFGNYYNAFFPQSLREQSDFRQQTADKFTRMSKMLSGQQDGYPITIDCDDTTDFCKKKYVAHMNDKTKTMNFCKAFFNPSTDLNAKSATYTAEFLTGQCANINLRNAQRAGAATLIHEITHTSTAMLGGKRTLDYAYGFNGCSWLSQNVFKRTCMPYHRQDSTTYTVNRDGDGNELPQDPNLAARNADTYSHIAAGIYFEKTCNRAPPFPDLPDPPSLAPDACPYVDDALIIDDSAEDDDPTEAAKSHVEGMVHFGDSYASGMGTGTTSGDSCRVGSNNYGVLVQQTFLNAFSDPIDYQGMSCSGDTVDGFNSQIDRWSNADKARIGTVTIGGNDLNFSDLVYYCVITPNTARLGSTNRNSCVEVENQARQYMEDTSGNGLRAKLTAAYLKAINKSPRTDFQLYVTSYPPFFNADTTTCDDSSFHYWWGAYKPISDFPTNRIVYLTQDLRTELNGLVAQLNGLILGAVQDANNQHGGNRVHFVDVVPSFDNHHWCEGSTQEPDSSNPNTWFFLSGWPDLGFDSASEENDELKARIAAGPIILPDASNCEAELGPQPDPFVKAMCRISQEIHDDPQGPQALRFAQANADIAAGDVSSQNIPWYLLTRTVKTFHPRSPGMAAFAAAVVDAIETEGQLN